MADTIATLAWDQKQVFFIVFVVTRYLPEINIEDVWCHNLLETSLDVLAAHKVYELVVDLGPMRKEESAARRILSVPEE
jgi:hypothetical protein